MRSRAGVFKCGPRSSLTSVLPASSFKAISPDRMSSCCITVMPQLQSQASLTGLSRALTHAVLSCSGAPAAQQSMGAKPRRRTNADLDELQHPLLGDQPTLQLMTPKDATGARLSSPPQSRDNAARLMLH